MPSALCAWCVALMALTTLVACGGSTGGDVIDNVANNTDNNDSPDVGDLEDVAPELDAEPPEDLGVVDDVGGDAAPQDGGPLDDAAGDDVGDEDAVGEPDVSDEDVPDVSCEDFALGNDTLYALPLRSVPIQVAGGSGQRQWRAGEGNEPDSSVNQNTGVFLTGAAEGVTQTVSITDVACDLTLTVTIYVVESAEVIPRAPEVPVGGRICFEVQGGSVVEGEPEPPFSWEFIRGNEGGDNAQVDEDGCYRAGQLEGLDVLVMTDTRTGQVVQVGVRVVAEVSLRLTVPVLMMPPGEQYSVEVEGGSGFYVYEVSPPARTGTRLRESEGAGLMVVEAGETPGEDVLVVRDAFFSRLTVRLPVVVLGSFQQTPTNFGNHTDDTDVVGVGDVNGDGFNDVMVSYRAFSLNGYLSGAAYLHLGGPDGLSPEPEQIIVGGRRFESLGRSMAAGDFDGDGCQDVAIGVWGEDLGRSEVGQVRIYTGCHQGEGPDFFEEDWNGRLRDNVSMPPGGSVLRLWQSLSGIGNADRFGWSVTAGDFNGDGLDDLAVAAYRAEASARRCGEDPCRDLGRVYVFFQEEGEMRDLPDLYLDGLFINGDPEDQDPGNCPHDPDADAAYPAANIQFGSGRLSSGDVNGDGCDDLLVGSNFGSGNNGLASLHVSSQDEESPGGCLLDLTPSLVIRPRRNISSRLGRDVALADVDGDCLADLVVGQRLARRFDTPNGGNAGAVNVFLGDPAWNADAPRCVHRDEADWVGEGQVQDQYSWSLDAGDVTGDGVADVVVGAIFAEDSGTVVNVGEVLVYPGQGSAESCEVAPGVKEAPLGEPLQILNAAHRRDDYFGATVAALGDVDGDDVGDLGIFAPRGPNDLEDVTDHRGRFFWAAGGEAMPTYEGLGSWAIPAPLVDERFGQRVGAIGDINGDGYTDFFGAAPEYDRQVDNTTHWVPFTDAGAVYLYLGGPEGVDEVPDAIFADHTMHSAGDQFGASVASGDFDGDGRVDLIVGAPFDEPNSLCTRCRIGTNFPNDVGALFVYRGRDTIASPRPNSDSPLPRLSVPDAVICGPTRFYDPVGDTNLSVTARIARELSSGFDANGDGFDDVLMANWNHNSSRGLVFSAQGQPLSGDGQTEVICMGEDSLLTRGDAANDRLGEGLTGLDLDGDGYDEMLASGFGDDRPGRANAGVVHVWFGAPSPAQGQPAPPRVHITLSGERSNDNIGYRLAAPGDMNGDRIPELAIASTGYNVGNEGAVLIIDGAQLRERLVGVQDGDDIVLNEQLVWGLILEPERIANTNFGFGLAEAGDLDGDGLNDLIVGAQRSNRSGQLRSGAAYVYSGTVEPGELNQPTIVIGGHTRRADAEFGRTVAASRVSDDGPAVIMVGAPLGEVDGPEQAEMGVIYFSNMEQP